ncbi:MAG: tetratricopeptide repeat protein, partial [Bryobacteraceae bacterium]
IARRLSIAGAWLAGLVFALHPVCVEAVAWISEQKSTLSAVFYLSALLVYLHFDRTRRTKFYGLALALCVLALLSKTITATLPAALLVIFWWQRGRIAWKRDALPLVPWFAVGATAGLFTAWVERTYIGAEGADFTLSFLDRVLLAGRVLWFYFSKLIWPSNLTFHYPRWNVSAAVWWQYLFALGVLVLTGVFVWLARRRRGPLASLLLFGGTLFPALGFFNVYPFLYSYVADHFQYLASLAVLVPLSNILASLPRKFVPVSATLVLVTFGVLSWSQCHMYQDSDTLYRETITRNPSSWLAQNNLGANLLENHGLPEEAIPYFQASLRLNPNYSLAHNNLGNAFGRLGRFPEAVVEYQTSIRLKPEDARTHTNLGNALANLGRLPEAVAEHQTALSLDPRSPEIRNNLGSALAQMGRFPEAIGQFEAALELDPAYYQAHRNLAFALLKMGRFPEAAAALETVVRLDPDSAEAHFTLGYALAQVPGRLPDAIAEYEAALRIKPDFEAARINLTNALARMNRQR